MIARLGLGSTQLSGGADNDLLIGGANDGLVGGAGDDTLVVRGLGNRLIGGSGRDLFVLADAAFGAFSPGATAPNRILDFTAADTLAFNLPGLQRSDIKLVETTAGTLVQLSEAWSVRLGASDLAVLQGVHGVSESQLAINQGVSALTPAILSRVDLINQTA
jgi:Ca2+-binding RTX toxin-like protein